MTQQPISSRQKNTSFLSDSLDARTVWLRAIFVFFYAGLLLATLLNRLFPGVSITWILEKGVRTVYAPGMIFAAGCLLGLQDASRTTFRKNTLYKALTCLLLFYGIGFFNEVLLNDRAVFATIKDLLAILRVPNTASIFLTLSVFFLFFGLFWEKIERCLQKPLWGLCLSLAGFLCSFIPEGLLGYALTGVFVGGDRYGCIPAAQYFFVFFAGILFTRKRVNATPGSLKTVQKRSLLSGFYRLLIPEGFLLVCGVLLAVLHQKQPALVLIGTALAGICLLLVFFLLPLYRNGESAVLCLLHWLRDRLSALQQKRQRCRWLDILLYFVGYTFLFFVVAYFIFAPYLQENRSLIWSVDGLGQYIPKIHRFIEYVPAMIQDLLHGNLDFQQYDFTTGMGATMSISYEPIYWLYLLFNPSQVESAYSLLIVLRYFLAGASMSVLLLYFHKPHWVSYTASMVYAFSGYALYAGTKHSQFLIPLMLLPVLVVAMEQLITRKKWYLLTVLTGISLLCSYYFLYINTFALGIYFVTRILCTKEYRNIKTFFTRGLIIAGSYVLGCSIGIISIFTSFGNYVGSSRSGGSKLADFLTTTPLFYRKEWISDFFVSFISDSFSPGMWLKLGFAPAALLVLILLFTRKNKKELKPMFLIFTLFCMFPVFGFILSGFSSVTNRWGYVYTVLIVFILAEHLDNLCKLSQKELYLMTGLVFLYGGIVFFSTKYRTDKIFGVFGLLTLTLVVIFMINHTSSGLSKQTARLLISGITIVAVVLNANLFMTSKSDTGSHMETYVEYGQSVPRMSKTALRYLDQVTDKDQEDGFYRSTNLKTYGDTRCSSMLYGYNDISTFTSTLNGGIVDYNRAMGNCDWNVVSIYSYNFRTYMHELASVRYLGGISKAKITPPYGYEPVWEKKKGKNTYTIYENQYTLPLGYTYDTILPESEAEKLSAAEKQEATMVSAIMEDDRAAANDTLKQTSASRLPLTAKRIEILEMKAKGGASIHKDSITVDEEGGSVKFTFKGEPNAETYLSLKGDLYFPKDAAEHFMETQVKSGDVSYEYKFRIDSYSTKQEEFLFNLGYNEDSVSTCTLKFKKPGTIRFEDIAVYCQSMDSYGDRVSALKESALENVKTEKNTVTGTITTKENKMLVITLPYQKGWTAWVDGQQVDIEKVNYQYMGLPLTPGKHDIRLHFQLPHLQWAFLITGAGIGLFVLIILFNFIRKRLRQTR